ncbi:hypothetical protein [Streptomyces sp. NBC_00576]|uniref:hypothetical protein n=1 Tax=Streptomyces sp. NBC_00576 TaxID=2903665 RepID=UPI002E80FE7E|nr:hypothetical protein [Streptomyces sp. NBC_00576]WUB74150.1 hypothetical protein OG734_31060 [Streptomyces sp. NBC_00576]
MTREEEKEQKARKGWREVPLAFVAFMLLGGAVLKFVFAVLALLAPGSGFSAGKLLDALIHPVWGVLISCALLWIFARLKSRKKGSAQG